MSIFTRMADALGFGKGEVRPQNVTYSEAVMESFGVSPSGVNVTATSAMRVSAVAACVAKISGAIISMPLHVYRLDGDTPERMPRDALWYLLNEQCASAYTSASMWEGVSMAQLLRGDAYVLIRRSMSGAVRELLPLPWGCVSPVRTAGEGVRYYVSMPTHGINSWFDPSDILHFPGLGFDDATMRSMSVIQYGARNAIGNAAAMDNYAGKFFEGGAHPSIILEAAGKMNPEQIAALQAAFVAKHAGLDNAHRIPLVLTEGLSAKEISLSAADAQLLEARKFQVLDVARAFGVPGFLINESTGATSWGSGIESIGRSFVQYTLQPWLRKIEQELNRKLFPRDSGKFIEFYRDALIEGDSAAQGAYFRLALGGPGSGDGFMSVNEIRKVKRMAPIVGGDDPFKALPPTAPAPDTGKQDAAAAQNLIDMRQIANDAQKPTIVNVAAPIVNVTVPEQTAPQVTNVVNVPEQAAPVVNNTVNIPETVVNVEAVMPTQETVVNVAAPVVNAPVYNNNIVNTPDSVKMEITAMPTRSTTSTVSRDGSGNITKAVNTEKDA
jgi:HK97 family phage portal protein